MNQISASAAASRFPRRRTRASSDAVPGPSAVFLPGCSGELWAAVTAGTAARPLAPLGWTAGDCACDGLECGQSPGQALGVL